MGKRIFVVSNDLCNRPTLKVSNIYIVYLKYVGHIAFLMGKTREALGLDKGDNISRLISKLDKKHPGLKEIFVPPSGAFNSRTGIIIRRAG